MRRTRRLWPGRAALVAALLILFVIGCDLLGFGPNLGLPFGYYGRFNRIMDRLEDAPGLDVLGFDLHRDTTLEDFFITVRSASDGVVRLRFQEASDRPFDELLQELKRVGL